MHANRGVVTSRTSTVTVFILLCAAASTGYRLPAYKYCKAIIRGIVVGGSRSSQVFDVLLVPTVGCTLYFVFCTL